MGFGYGVVKEKASSIPGLEDLDGYLTEVVSKEVTGFQGN